MFIIGSMSVLIPSLVVVYLLVKREYFPRPIKALVMLALIKFLFEVVAIIPLYFKVNTYGITQTGLENTYLSLEFILFAYYFRSIVIGGKKWTSVFVGQVVLWSIALQFSEPANQFSVFVLSVGSIVVTILALHSIYQVTTYEKVLNNYNYKLWFAVAAIITQIGHVPLIDYLSDWSVFRSTYLIATITANVVFGLGFIIYKRAK